MKSHRLLQFRMFIALVLGIVFIAAVLNSHLKFHAMPPPAPVWPTLEALFGLIWIVQAYSLTQQIKAQDTH